MFRHNRTKIMEREIKNLKEERQSLERGLKKLEARQIDLQGDYRRAMRQLTTLETMMTAHMGAPFSAPNSGVTVKIGTKPRKAIPKKPFDEPLRDDDEYKGLSSVAHKLAGKNV